MKLKFIKLTGVLMACGMLSGCGGANFFDVQTAMHAPRLSETQEEVKKCVTEYMNSDLIWKYTWFEDGYSALIKCELAENSPPVYVACCRAPEESKKLHILFVNRLEDKWKVVYDSIHITDEINNIVLEDIDSDGIKEIVIYNKNFENSTNSMRCYKVEKNIIKEIKKY